MNMATENLYKYLIITEQMTFWHDEIFILYLCFQCWAQLLSASDEMRICTTWIFFPIHTLKLHEFYGIQQTSVFDKIHRLPAGRSTSSWFGEVKILEQDVEEGEEETVQAKPISSSVRWSSPSCRTKGSEVEIYRWKNSGKTHLLQSTAQLCFLWKEYERKAKTRLRGKD